MILSFPFLFLFSFFFFNKRIIWTKWYINVSLFLLPEHLFGLSFFYCNFTILFLFFVYTFGCKIYDLVPYCCFSLKISIAMSSFISQCYSIFEGAGLSCRLVGWRGEGKWASAARDLSQVPQHRAILHPEVWEVVPSATGWASMDHSAAPAKSRQGFLASPTKACADVVRPPTSGQLIPLQ